jgi:hypothetical protein
MDRIANELLERSKAEIGEIGGATSKSHGGRGKNLLALLLRANMATDLPDHQRMSEEEVLAREFLVLIAMFANRFKVRHCLQKYQLSLLQDTRQRVPR